MVELDGPALEPPRMVSPPFGLTVVGKVLSYSSATMQMDPAMAGGSTTSPEDAPTVTTFI